MEFCFPLVADHAIRKIAINAKAVTRGKFPRHIQICAINIVAKFSNTPKQSIAFGSADRGNRLAGMASKRQDKNAKGNYSKKMITFHS